MTSINRILNLSVLFTLSAYLIVNTASEPSDLSEDAEKIDYRLPTKIKPISYVIDLTPYFDNSSGREAFTFDGSVEINLQTEFQDVKEIVLHVKDIDIKKYKLEMISKFPSWLRPEYHMEMKVPDNVTDKLTMTLNQPLEPNKIYVMNFEYIGKLQTDMHGFYRSSYEENGKTVWLASTQMEPVHARKVFPCFDEPQFKATFQVHITRPIDFQPTISNTRIANTKVNEKLGIVRETFEVTPKMSTYLLAFVVSKFKCRKNNGDTFSVCSRPNAFNQTEYSFDIGQSLLANFDELFQYQYSSVPEMKKMTMVALPDFSAGAMENWGLLTYRETALLYDPSISTAMSQQRVAAVVAHEQTHMWFGDLVTCHWWSHTWLNEGFARFFQYFALAMIESKWELEQQFVVEQLQNVFNRDSLDDTFPLSNNEVYSPDDIANMFGTISYNKGASIIRMIEHIMGHNSFINGLRTYLKDNAFQTAIPDKLYSALQSTLYDNFNIGQIMKSWIEQVGYPVVHVTLQDDRKTIELKQRQFLLNEPNHDKTSLWHIPITYATSKEDFSNTQTNVILSSSTMNIALKNEVDWIIFNVQQTGYYRVNYDAKIWKNIDRVLHESPSDIHVLNRAQIVDDALNLARGNSLSYTQALRTVQYLKNETEYIPWYAALTNFNFILNRFNSHESAIFEEYILSLIDNVYSHLGFEPKDNETRLDVYNRGLILKYACRLGHKECISDAINEFEKLTRDESTIPVDLKPVIYCTVINRGTNETWQHLWTKFQKENVAAEQVVILNALGCTSKTDLVLNYINEILGEKIRLQDKHSALVSLLSQPQNIDVVLNYVLDNHKQITKVFESKDEVPSILSLLASHFTSDEQIAKANKFVEENKSVLGSVETLRISLKNANYNLKWAEKNIPAIKKYLKSDPSFAYTIVVSTAISVMLPISVYLFI